VRASNIFSQIPSNLKDEFFEEIISKDGLKIERIISKGHTTTDREWYNQKSDEWVIVLRGEALLSFENSDDVKLQEGDYINILAYTKHRVSWTKPDIETIWLAIHY